MRLSLRNYWVAASVTLAMAAAAPADDISIVTATGNGITARAALKDALRNALEKGAGVELSSFSRAENFELIRDTIFSRSDGLVSNYRVLDQGEGVANTYFCKIQAEVSASAVAKTWGEVQNVLSQIGRPKVMVFIAEKIDGRTDESSILESKIEQRLIASGFDVYDSTHLDAIQAKEAAYAVKSGNDTRMRALAKKFGAQIYVMGHANANKARNTSPHGVDLVMYNCDVQAKVYYTDTGRLLASETIPMTRGGARGYTDYSHQAGKVAVFNAAQPLIQNIYNAVMKSWSTQISFGGEISIEIDGFASASQAFRLKTSFKEIPGVGSVNGPSYTDGMGVYRVVATMTAEDLMEYLARRDWNSRIKVVDVTQNRIQAKWIGD